MYVLTIYNLFFGYYHINLDNKVVVIGCSSGGPPVLGKILPNLPSNYPPVVVVLHIAAQFLDSLVERMNVTCNNRVRVAKHADRVKPGRIYFAPGGYHLEFKKIGNSFVNIHLTDHAPKNHVKPAADITLISASQTWGSNVVAVILTGMGKDGMLGCQFVREMGGYVIAQDEESSAIYGMNKAVIDADLAHVIVDPDSIPTHISMMLKKMD